MLAMTCLPDVVTEIESRFPALRIELTVENSNALHAQIAADKLDLAFLSRPSVGVDVRLQPIASAPVAWLGASAKRLSVARLRPADLDGKTILSLPPGSPLYSMVAAWCAPAEVLPARRFSTCNSTAVIAGLVASGVAMSVLPLPVLARAIDQGDVVAYGQDEPFKRLSVCAAFSRTIRPGQFDSVVELVAEIIRRHRYFGPAEQH
jgi:DNA-binding transcriptional LysR family regulator